MLFDKLSIRLKEKIGEGKVIESLDELIEWLIGNKSKVSNLSSFLNEAFELKFRYNSDKKDRVRGILPFTSNEERNKIASASLLLIDCVKSEVNISVNFLNTERAKIELVTNYDFNNFQEKDFNDLFGRLKSYLKCAPDDFTFINKRMGSVILEFSASFQATLGLTLINKIEVIEELIKLRVSNFYWNNYLESKKELIGLYRNRIELRKASLFKAKLENLKFYRGFLEGANLKQANLQNADLRGANLSSTNLEEADLRNADLSPAIFSLTNLSGANLRGTDLRGADLYKAIVYPEQLKSSRLDFAIFHISQKEDLLKAGINIFNVKFIDEIDGESEIVNPTTISY